MYIYITFVTSRGPYYSSTEETNSGGYAIFICMCAYIYISIYLSIYIDR